jgi:hypothetical protein
MKCHNHFQPPTETVTVLGADPTASSPTANSTLLPLSTMAIPGNVTTVARYDAICALPPAVVSCATTSPVKFTDTPPVPM